MPMIETMDELEALYGQPAAPSLAKVATVATAEYRTLIEASPFAVLATCGPEGIDCSPRGDRPGFVRIHDDRTLMLPDRAGNNRIDSLRNIMRDPRTSLLFLIPRSGTTVRVNGKAHLTADEALLDSFAVDGKPPRSVLVLEIDEIYFQCARAIVRSHLWDPEIQVDPKSLPTPGRILAVQSDNTVGGDAYDKEWPDRARKSLW